MKGFLVIIGIALMCLGFLYTPSHQPQPQPDLNIYDTIMPADAGLVTLEVVTRPVAGAFSSPLIVNMSEKTWHASEVAGCFGSRVLRKVFRIFRLRR